MANCINCGADLTDGEQYIEEEPVEPEYVEEYGEQLEIPAEFDEPLPDGDLAPDDDYEVPEETAEEPIEEYQESVGEPPKEPIENFMDEPLEEEVAEPIVDDIGMEEPILEPAPEIGAELPAEHDEHKQCPGCGIYVDINDTVCPVCDTVFENIGSSVSDDEIEIPSEDEEMAGFGIEAEPEMAETEPDTVEAVDEITVPEASGDHVECPSCGADLEAGTKVCPVCEYPIE